MAGDMVISLDAVDTIECEGLDEDDINSNGLETVVVKGGSLTLKSSSSVRFAFTAFFALAHPSSGLFVSGLLFLLRVFAKFPNRVGLENTYINSTDLCPEPAFSSSTYSLS